MDEHTEPEEAGDAGKEPAEATSPTDVEEGAGKEAEANLMAKIEMNVFGHP
jgi:hypothetical protein